MEAMRAGSESSSIIEVHIMEHNTFDRKSIRSWANDSVRTCIFKERLGVFSLTDNKGVVNTSILTSVELVGELELDTSQQVVSDLEVSELNCSGSFSDGSVSVVLPAGEAVEVGEDRSVGVVRISFVREVTHNWFARELSRNHVMEDSQTVSSIRVSRVVSEFSDSFVLRADVDVGRWTHGVIL